MPAEATTTRIPRIELCVESKRVALETTTTFRWTPSYLAVMVVGQHCEANEPCQSYYVALTVFLLCMHSLTFKDSDGLMDFILSKKMHG
jgi:hypothetical protein